MVPIWREILRQMFSDLAHKFFQNGAKIISFWREFFRPSVRVVDRNTSAYFLQEQVSLCNSGDWREVCAR